MNKSFDEEKLEAMLERVGVSLFEHLRDIDKNTPDYMSPELQRWLALYRAADREAHPPPGLPLMKKKPKPRNWRLDP